MEYQRTISRKTSATANAIIVKIIKRCMRLRNASCHSLSTMKAPSSSCSRFLRGLCRLLLLPLARQPQPSAFSRPLSSQLPTSLCGPTRSKNSSTECPSFTRALSHRGVAPRPAQASPPGPRYTSAPIFTPLVAHCSHPFPRAVAPAFCRLLRQAASAAAADRDPSPQASSSTSARSSSSASTSMSFRLTLAITNSRNLIQPNRIRDLQRRKD